MSRIIFIGGQLATGKTTLARKLSEELGITYFYKDKLKECLADSIGFSNREENLKLSKGVFEIFKEIVDKFVFSNQDLILDSNFRQSEIDYFQEYLKDKNCKIISIVLSGNDDILYSRYLNRFDKENRHPAHANFNNKEEFVEYNLMLKKVQYIGSVFEFNADNFVDVEKVLKVIQK